MVRVVCALCVLLGVTGTSVSSQTISIQSSNSSSVTVVNGRVRTTGSVIVGSGVVVTKLIASRNIIALEQETSANIEWYASSETIVEITADDNLVDRLVSVGPSGTLTVGGRQSFVSQSEIVVRVFSPSVNRAIIRGSGNCRLEGLNSKAVSITIEGSGDVDATGEVGSLNVTLKGSGDINCSELSATSVVVRSQGSGDISVSSHGSVSGSMNGAGDLNVYGQARVTVSNNGAGEINRY